MNSGSATSPSDPAAAVLRRGLLLVLSSPSGAGKTTLSRALLGSETGIGMSVSVTTRAPRPGEVDGRDYHFKTVPEFAALRDAGGLLEWATVHGNLYGTPKAAVVDELTAGRDVLFDIDWQGARQLEQQASTDVVRVFILPPSAMALGERLRKRAQDGPEVVARRLAGAATEIRHWDEYDYVIVNADFDRSLLQLKTILHAERLRRHRQPQMSDFVRDLLAGL